ncbi:MAG: type II secretion system protein [Fimbriimonadaceae bacterium]|nr:type II secretion system protein [Fimbriimonadaceae bacterium]
MNRNKKKAFTLVEIMIVVLIIGILLAIAVPNFITARQNSRAQTIIANLEQIEAAKEQCAMNEGLAVGDTCAGMGNYVKQWPVSWPVTGAAANETTIGTAATFRGRDAATWRTDKSGL